MDINISLAEEVGEWDGREEGGWREEFLCVHGHERFFQMQSHIPVFNFIST